MRLTNFVLAGLAVVSAAAAYASSAVGTASNPMTDNVLASIGIPGAHTAADACADFSGSWLVKCNYGAAAPFEEEMTIAQRGCDFVVLNGDFVGIGGGYTTSTASANSALHTDVTADWSADGKTLRISKEVSGRKLGEPTFLNLTFAGTMTMDGDKLTEVGTYRYQTTAADRVTSRDRGNVSCSFERRR